MGAAEDRRWPRPGVSADRVALAVGGVTLLAVLVRLVALGARTAHWDEARVAYWILDYAATGNYEYDAIIHGPFYHHVNRVVFDVLGANDFSMRLVVAVVGGLLPLAALLFRERLGDAETVALALFFAANPVVLYYSRFMRGDPIVAFTMLAAFGLFVRTVDSGRRSYLFAGTVLFALAFTAKENALIYPVTWAGATVLLLDHRLFRARDRDEDWVALLKAYLWRAGGAVRAWILPLVLALVEFVAIIVFFYAPRRQTTPGPGLWEAVGDPSHLVTVLEAATVGSWMEFYGLWVEGSHQDHAYLPFLGDFLQTMGHGALALSLLAVLGFVLDRYSEGGPRDLVAFAFYWGFVSVLGYPIVTDIKAPWATLHAVVPLAIPAAVGVGVVYRWGRESLAAEDRIGVGLAAFLLLLVAGTVAGTAVTSVYVNPQSEHNELVQYAQPAGDLDPAVREMRAAAGVGDNPAVILYGEFYVDGDESATREPACAKWFNALPLPWYFATTDVSVSCAEDAESLASVAESRPPMVVAAAAEEDTLRRHYPDYEVGTYLTRAWDKETVVFVRPDVADAADRQDA